ncbi:MAG TPA: hypothetical protein VH062_01225 [Polyangiaceae bacterium]|jgi:hypothetical protein|nr:hypothetical protein [Polyangiaceae bacterium]
MPWAPKLGSAALAAVLAVVLRPDAARAASSGDEPPSLAIPVELLACSDVDRTELEKLLAIEYQTLGVEPRNDGERVVVTCSGERAQLTLEPGGASSGVELSGTSVSAWPRLLALAVSELVIEARARIATASTPVKHPGVAARPSETSAPVAKTLPLRLRLFAGARAQWLPHAAASLWGPELGFATGAFFPLSIELRARIGFGSTSTEVARVGWTVEGGSVAVRWDVRAGRFTAGGGPGFSLDALQLAPTVKIDAAHGQRVSGAFGGPELDVYGSVALGSALLIYARIDAGFLALPVRGDVSDGRRLVDASGGFIGAALGAGAQF